MSVETKVVPAELVTKITDEILHIFEKYHFQPPEILGVLNLIQTVISTECGIRNVGHSFHDFDPTIEN